MPAGLPPRTDFVLAADCVYFEPAFPLLVATLCDLADSNGHGHPDPEILFCYKKRRKVWLINSLSFYSVAVFCYYHSLSSSSRKISLRFKGIEMCFITVAFGVIGVHMRSAYRAKRGHFGGEPEQRQSRVHSVT